jgi:predicted HAD superfamily Cof-like phosphohydrolase
MTDFQLTVRSFESQILYFNGMYKLPVAPYPSVDTVAKDVVKRNPDIPNQKQALLKRLSDFKSILQKELNEVDEIVAKLSGASGPYGEIDLLTDMADWLGDIQVYCASEMIKYGISNTEVLKIIMASNFSKLGSNGEPIYDEEGKVLKGPGYWKPEPKIKAYLEEVRAERKEQPTGIVWRE